MDNNQFDTWWIQIRGDKNVPKTIANYIERDWLSYKQMWSAMSRQNHTIFEEGDTNMLLEAYVICLIIYLNMLIFHLDAHVRSVITMC